MKSRQEDAKNYAEYLNRIQLFYKQNNVSHTITSHDISDFMANPFVYEGKRIAFYGSLETMFSGTEGVFAVTTGLRTGAEMVMSDMQNHGVLVLSRIPKGLIPSKGTILIAGEVIGKTTLETSTGRQVSVPHLSFVALDKCTLSEWKSQKCN